MGNVSISLPLNSGSYAAVDTGTTLIGGPPDVIDQIAAEIPGSTPGTGDYQNYFFYRMLAPLLLSTTLTYSIGCLSQLAIQLSPSPYHLVGKPGSYPLETFNCSV